MYVNQYNMHKITDELRQEVIAIAVDRAVNTDKTTTLEEDIARELGIAIDDGSATYSVVDPSVYTFTLLKLGRSIATAP